MRIAANRHKTRQQVLAFVPEHCPYEQCPDHLLRDPSAYRFLRRGTRRTRRKPGIVRRYTCCRCGRSFSSSSFFELYRRRFHEIPEEVFRGFSEGQSERQIARTNRVGVKTVQWLKRYMGGQALLFHLVQLGRLAGRVDETIGFDGLQTFVLSQWEPGDLQTAAANESGYLLDIDYVGLRRSGRMTPRQLATRAVRERRFGRPPRGVGVRKTRQALERLSALPPPGSPLALAMDEHTGYATAVREVRAQGVAIEVTTVSSHAWRQTAGHPLWRINHEHRLMRHGMKNHTRETLAFSKTTAGLLDRGWTYVVWRNHVKGVSERHGQELSNTTPAMRLGLADAPLDADAIFHRRLFPRRVGLPRELRDHYDGTARSRPREYAGTRRDRAPRRR